ncbi:MAG TPA: PQQ-dependent sugar dehydrogenase, partial [Planctomycetota bacterium]|nr:PQQ-dependent sugar dehydrogenase [Planctomycetota bacterium]
MRRPFFRRGLSLLVTTLLVTLLMSALLWRRGARAHLKDIYDWLRNRDTRLELNTRPDMDRFGFDRQVLEFSRTPPVDQAVNDPESPGYTVRRGLEAKVHSSGYTYPVNIAFARDPPQDDASPFYYVAELHGNIRYATRQGKVGTFAEGLLSFPPSEMKISDELGISGLTLVPGTNDLIITHPVLEVSTGLFQNALTRLHSADGGRSCSTRETILVLKGEATCPSNQIQQASFGPDAKLHVSVGDAMNFSLSRNLGRWGGKILRMNADGTACGDNPFYDPKEPGSPKSYVFSMGLRNSFDFVFDPSGERIWAGDVGEVLNRLVATIRGADHGWDGTPESFCRSAAYLFHDGFVPVGITLVDPRVMGDDFKDCVWVGGYSYYFGPGPGGSKRILSFR